MFEYTSKYCIMGMMSKNSEPFENWAGFRKNKKSAVSFDINFIPDFPKVSFSYLYTKPNTKYRKSTQVVSKLNDDFFKLSGKKYKEIRETRNKFDKIIGIGPYDKNKVLEMIEVWDRISGGKYGWQRHSGYDRNFFERWFLKEQDNLFSRFYYLDGNIVGYSVLHKNNNCYDYLIRKTDNSIRNTCLYVDYKTFEEIYKADGEFLVNWGASEKGVLRYKKKFPVFQESAVYFCNK